MPDRAAIDATIDLYLSSFSDNNADAWLSCWATDGWTEDPVGTPRRVGHDALRTFFEEAHSLADAVELRGSGLRIVVGNEAVFTMQARPTMGDQTYMLDVIDHMTFDDEAKISTLRAFFDPTTMRPAEDS
jgi:steroid delta-isomerase